MLLDVIPDAPGVGYRNTGYTAPFLPIDDPGDDLPVLGYRNTGFNAPAIAIPGIHFQEGKAIPMHHRATGKWYIDGEILEWQQYLVPSVE